MADRILREKVNGGLAGTEGVSGEDAVYDVEIDFDNVQESLTVAGTDVLLAWVDGELAKVAVSEVGGDTLPQPLGAADTPTFAGVRVDTGSLGIGTDTPTDKVHILTASGTAPRVRTQQTGWRSWSFGNVASSANFSIQDETGSTARLTIDTNGVVSIAGLSVTASKTTIGTTGTASASATGAGALDIRGVLDVQGAAHGMPRLIQSEKLGTTAMSMETVTIGRGFPVMRAGSITGLALAYDVTANTDGELEAVVAVMRAGALQDTWLIGTPLPSTVDDDLSFVETQGRGVVTFAAGDVIVVEITESNGSVTLRDVRAMVDVVFD